MTSPGFQIEDWHEPPLFGIDQLVEMGVGRIHARAAYCFKLLLGQLRSSEAAAAFAKALELLIFIGTDEIAGDLAVSRDGNRLTAGIRDAGKTPLFRSA